MVMRVRIGDKLLSEEESIVYWASEDGKRAQSVIRKAKWAAAKGCLLYLGCLVTLVGVCVYLCFFS